MFEESLDVLVDCPHRMHHLLAIITFGFDFTVWVPFHLPNQQIEGFCACIGWSAPRSQIILPIASKRCAPCVTNRKGGVVVMGKSAAVTFVEKPDWHSLGAGFVGGFQGGLSITLVTPLHSKIVWTIHWPAITRPNADNYTKKSFGNLICNDLWSDSNCNHARQV